MSKKVLLISDDGKLTAALKSELESDRLEVIVSRTTKAAEEALTSRDFVIVVCELWASEINGLEILKFVSSLEPVPVLVLADPRETEKIAEANSLGAYRVLNKPVDPSTILALVRARVVGSEAEAADGDAESDHSFCKVFADDLLAAKQANTDVYLRAPNGKYMRVFAKGTAIATPAVKALRKANVRTLYLRAEDFRKSIGFHLAQSMASKIAEAPTLEQKLGLLKHAGEIIVEHVFFDEVSQDSFEAAQTVVESTVSVLSDDPALYKLLNTLNSYADWQFSHALGVAIYSNLIARTLGWSSQSTSFKISLAGLLHDVAMSGLEPELLARSDGDLTAEERKELERHVARGGETLSRISSIPSEVVQIVLHHHEHCGGTGYPSGIKMSQIHPLARVVAVADRFCELAVRGPSDKVVTPHQALEKMWKGAEGGRYDAVALGALMKVFKAPLPPEIASAMPKGWNHI